MSFELGDFDAWKAHDPKAESRDGEQPERDEVARYRLMFSWPTCHFEGTCVVAHFDRFDERTAMWIRLDSGVGNDEWQAIRALRTARYEQRSLGRELKHRAARKMTPQQAFESAMHARAIRGRNEDRS